MLDREDDQHQDRADDEGGVEVKRAKTRNGDVERFPDAHRRGKRLDRRGGLDGCDGIGSGDTRIRGHVVDDRLAFGGELGAVGGDPVKDRLAAFDRDREQRVQDIARRDGTTQRQDRRPGEPVAPDRQGRDHLRIAQPGGGPIDRCPARLVAEHPRDLGIGEGLRKAHDHRHDPDHESGLPGHARDPADREQHKRRHPGRHPKCAAPVKRALQLRRIAGSP